MLNVLQLFWDSSFGSDALIPYSANYAWLANQMAHAMMGFCFAAVWALHVKNRRRFVELEKQVPSGTQTARGILSTHFIKSAGEPSNLPFNYYRLANLNVQENASPGEDASVPLTKDSVETVKGFQQELSSSRDQRRRLAFVIVGGNPQQRDRLATALACEYAFRIEPNRLFKPKASQKTTSSISAVSFD